MKAEQLLMELGIYPHLKGFEYICDALEIIKSGQRQMMLVYMQISKTHNDTVPAVERCIRHAFTKMDCEKAKEYLGDCPRTNSALLYMLNFILKNQGKESC